MNRHRANDSLLSSNNHSVSLDCRSSMLSFPVMSDLKIPCESYIGVTNLGCLFYWKCKCSAHKAGQKVAPPLVKHSSHLGFQWRLESSEISLQMSSCSQRRFIQQLFFRFDPFCDFWHLCSSFDYIKVHKLLSGIVIGFCSRKTENALTLRCICMQLCSQGPHLWPFISSQVKGLRDNEARGQTLLVRKGSSWWSVVQTALSTDTIRVWKNTFLRHMLNMYVT